MTVQITIMAWNISEGRMTNENLPNNVFLPQIAEQIRAKTPDIVLLNEVKNYNLWIGGWQGNYINQTKRIAELTGMCYYQWGDVNRTGWTGHKSVSVLSRYPLGTPRVHHIMSGLRPPGYGILETSVLIHRIKHHIFSTRFNAHNNDENIAAHRQAVKLIHELDSDTSVIFGGDFNTKPDSPQMIEFITNSGLKDAYLEMPDPQICDPDNRVDHIFYRGPYQIAVMQQRCPWNSLGTLSDHPWVFVELQKPEAAECSGLRRQLSQLEVKYDRTIAGAKGLDPKIDKPEIRKVNKEINKISAEIAEVKKRAAELDCW